VKTRFAALSPRAQFAIAAAAVLVWALALWFLLVAPKRSHAAGLSEDVVAAELQLADARLQSRRPQKPSSGAKVADLLRLAKAMPSSADQAGLVLELDRLARSSGVTLRSISPSEATIGAGGATTIPVVVTATGSYRQITRFLQHTRALVRVRGGAVRATGRLLTMQGVELSESSTRRFPYLDATIILSAFVYDGPIIPATPPPTSTESEDTSTGATAAGSTP
jgi:Tfp pilus assembly protein PilO